MTDKGGVTEFLLGFLVGGVVGAGTALLLAPAKGEDTRAMINKRLRELVDEGKTEVEALNKIYHDELEKINAQKEALKEAFDKGVETYKSKSAAKSKTAE